jgi:hypothetical protein
VEEAPTMHRDAGIGLLRRTPLAPDRACQVAVPPAAHASSTVSHVHDEDAFIVDVGPQSRPGIDTSCDTSRAGQPQAR